MEWYNVRHWGDVDYLKQQYGWFYDTCLTEIQFKSGAFVDEQETMYFGTPMEREIHMFFERQWKPDKLELCFTDVKRCNIAGWQEGSDNEMQGCFLELRWDLIPDRELIVWGDRNPFEYGMEQHGGFLQEPLCTYVIASKLKWRFI